MSDDIKARLTLALKCPGCIPQGTANLLQSCLKHIEELEEKIHKLESAKVWTRLDQLQSQLREREADCAAMRELLITPGPATTNQPSGGSSLPVSK